MIIEEKVINLREREGTLDRSWEGIWEGLEWERDIFIKINTK